MPYPVYKWHSLDRNNDDSYRGKSEIDHFYHLTAIEVLKEINFDDLDSDLAWQYGQVYDTPWKDCQCTIDRFRQLYPNVLYMHVLDKCLDSICEACAFITNIMQMNVSVKAQLYSKIKKHLVSREILSEYSFENFHYVGLTGAIVDQLDTIIESGKLLKNINKKQGKYVNERYLGNLKQLCSKVEILDKMMIMSFNNVGNENVMIAGENSYFRQDQVKYLLDLVTTMCNDEYNSASQINSRDFHFDTIRTMTYILSILLHSFHSNNVRPEREEDMFMRYAANNTMFMSIIQNIREFTNKSLAYILRYPFCIEAQPYNTNKPETRNIVRPFSLQERYLYWWYIEQFHYTNLN